MLFLPSVLVSQPVLSSFQPLRSLPPLREACSRPYSPLLSFFLVVLPAALAHPSSSFSFSSTLGRIEAKVELFAHFSRASLAFQEVGLQGLTIDDSEKIPLFPTSFVARDRALSNDGWRHKMEAEEAPLNCTRGTRADPWPSRSHEDLIGSHPNEPAVAHGAVFARREARASAVVETRSSRDPARGGSHESLEERQSSTRVVVQRAPNPEGSPRLQEDLKKEKGEANATRQHPGDRRPQDERKEIMEGGKRNGGCEASDKRREGAPNDSRGDREEDARRDRTSAAPLSARLLPPTQAPKDELETREESRPASAARLRERRRAAKEGGGWRREDGALARELSVADAADRGEEARRASRSVSVSGGERDSRGNTNRTAAEEIETRLEEGEEETKANANDRQESLEKRPSPRRTLGDAKQAEEGRETGMKVGGAWPSEAAGDAGEPQDSPVKRTSGANDPEARVGGRSEAGDAEPPEKPEHTNTPTSDPSPSLPGAHTKRGKADKSHALRSVSSPLRGDEETGVEDGDLLEAEVAEGSTRNAEAGDPRHAPPPEFGDGGDNEAEGSLGFVCFALGAGAVFSASSWLLSKQRETMRQERLSVLVIKFPAVPSVSWIHYRITRAALHLNASPLVELYGCEYKMLNAAAFRDTADEEASAQKAETANHKRKGHRELCPPVEYA
ncbi:hypothetical protein BESB_078780 [Besnoitia besnoiti]|uniref:Transmembrane protein n=1 Tax=Besnoitia besnoiti TaxID=94643 RepID=A0A2A9ME52_BESBE|nr:hypothetical protein BESB_078780 [Besnoitia besnoiti]PFH33662.1 hypothetical protein BESB_078780 [Besnoitia besnoiti]